MTCYKCGGTGYVTVNFDESKIRPCHVCKYRHEVERDRRMLRGLVVSVLALTLVAMVLAMSACGGFEVPTWPALPGNPGFEVDWRGHTVVDTLPQMLELIHEKGALECRSDDCLNQLAADWRGSILWYDTPFPCGIPERMVYGCVPWPSTYAIGWRPVLSDTALIDELAHLVWRSVHGRDGEQFVNGQTVYDLDFQTFVDNTRTAARVRSL